MLGILPAPVLSVVVGGDVTLFEVRSDVDGIGVALLACLLLHRLLTGAGGRWSLAGLVLSVVLVVLLASRAALLAALLGLALVLVVSKREGLSRDATRGLLLAVLTGLVLVASGAASAPAGSSLDRALNTAGSGSASGTVEARGKAWSSVTTYVEATPSRTLLGVGFGPHYVLDSGAYRFLSGATDVRAPHNWWLNVWARTGLVGLILFTSFYISVLTRLARAVAVARGPATRSACLLVVLLPVAATFGVVLEAPFAVVPFWWACGVVTSLSRTGESS